MQLVELLIIKMLNAIVHQIIHRETLILNVSILLIIINTVLK